MNKKQLRESIMTGVRRSFKKNKSLNEGFLEWQEQNVPKINYDLLNKYIEKISGIFEKLMQAKQIGMLQVVYHNVNAGNWSTLTKFNPENIGSVSISNTIDEAIKKIKNIFNDEDKFVSSINEIYIKFYIPKSSHLMKYIQSTIDPGSNRIKNKSYLTLINGDENNIGIRFSLQSLLDFSDEIVEYFWKKE